jgi:hypothetical protein
MAHGNKSESPGRHDEIRFAPTRKLDACLVGGLPGLPSCPSPLYNTLNPEA